VGSWERRADGSDYFSDKLLEIDGDIVTTGRDAIVSHPFGNLEGIVGTKPTKRFAGESSEFSRLPHLTPNCEERRGDS
jgi:hypothetical protein